MYQNNFYLRGKFDTGLCIASFCKLALVPTHVCHRAKSYFKVYSQEK